MHLSPRKRILGFVTLVIAAASIATSASAITVEIARTCDAAVAKAFPPRVPGNPAAGSAAGSGAGQRAYYSKCVADAESAQNAGKADGAGKPASVPK